MYFPQCRQTCPNGFTFTMSFSSKFIRSFEYKAKSFSKFSDCKDTALDDKALLRYSEQDVNAKFSIYKKFIKF